MAAPSLALLRIMAAEKRSWNLLQLQAASKLSEKELTDVLQWLRHQKLIRRIKLMYCVTPAGAALANDPEPAPKIIRSDLRSMVWRALRMRGKSSVTELLEVIGKPATRGTRQNVRTYLAALCRVEVVAVSRFKAPNGERLYQIMRDLGPTAPATEKGTGRMFDPNSGQPLMGAANAA